MQSKKYPLTPADSEQTADSILVEDSRLPSARVHVNPTDPSTNESAQGPDGGLLASKYRLVKQLGTGGMGTVWLATNETLGSDVAIKLIRNDLQQADLTARLMAEARAVAHLRHPNIVRVFDVGLTPQGQPFLVMELLHGQSLGFKIRREGRLRATVAVQTLLPIAHALALAHDQGIVHRDLKPDNIVLEERDDLGTRPVLLDFGIAKNAATLGSTRLTQDGSTLGSPEYMSPEQACGEEVTAQADMWAFCVVLYETLLGHVPFTDTNYHRLLRRIIDEPIPSFSRMGIRDDDLWAIIEKGLRKNPSKRFEHMRSIGGSLALWLLAQGVTEDIGNASIRATWLQPPTTGSRHPIVSDIDAVETQALCSSGVSVRSAPGAPRKKRYPMSRIGWFVAIFVTSILATILAKPWIRSLTGVRAAPYASSIAKDSAMSPGAPLSSTVHAATDDGATRATTSANAPVQASATATAKAEQLPTANSLASRNTAAVASTWSDARRAVSSQHSSGISSANVPRPPTTAKSAAPTKLDIKTDF